MLCTFSFGCFQIYQNKSAKNIAIYFIGTIVSIKYMPKISAVGLFCLDKFENNQTRMRTIFFRTSKLTELYFNWYKYNQTFLLILFVFLFIKTYSTYSWVSKVFTHCLCKEQNYPNNRLCVRKMGGSSLL